ncbi:hypothetical protein [Microbulbifer sp. THAF38]|uniref:hypothetical protein n=1 Tax=Microbulbifer sp. THAF38 TaxID=2587856 RepID=UPI001268C5D6|nr:hypothetical protein [Microbulbifer sp. THAF38]QFT55587.1 hypothetical protein FIU95_13615 [Microbulbifer sp. THAF38]
MRSRKSPKETEKQGFLKTFFKGRPDPFKPGTLVNIEAQRLRVIASDKETVTFNVNGVPTVWQRQWLNDYDDGHISILDK